MEKRFTLGDTPEYAWKQEFVERCFPESGGRVSADFQMAEAMCKAEPKCAQFVMQSFAQDIRSGRPDKEAIEFLRFALGVLFTAYVGLACAEGRCSVGGLPAELELAVRWNPEIIACANELGPIDGGDGEG